MGQATYSGNFKIDSVCSCQEFAPRNGARRDGLRIKRYSVILRRRERKARSEAMKGNKRMMQSVTAPHRLFVLLVWTAGLLAAQNASLRGVVTDASGAVVPGAKVTLQEPGSPEKATLSAGDGTYIFAGLA